MVEALPEAPPPHPPSGITNRLETTNIELEGMYVHERSLYLESLSVPLQH